jgi:hypothetical protein
MMIILKFKVLLYWINENGFSASVLLSSTTGNGYVDGTKFEAKYFIALVIKPNEKHDSIYFTGASNQRKVLLTIIRLY